MAKPINPFVKSLKVSVETHQRLRMQSIQLGCRVSFLTDFILNEHLKDKHFGEIAENPIYIKAKEQIDQLDLDID